MLNANKTFSWLGYNTAQDLNLASDIYSFLILSQIWFWATNIFQKKSRG